MTVPRSITAYGFTFGAATVQRAFCDDRKGWVVILLKTPKYPHGLQLYVTKTGNIRVLGDNSEWMPCGPTIRRKNLKESAK